MMMTLVRFKGAVSAGGLKAAGANGSFIFLARSGLGERCGERGVRVP